MSELALKLIHEASKTKAKSLDLINCGLTTIPKEVFNLTWLEELYLSNEHRDSKKRKSKNNGEYNQLTEIPDSIKQLKKLKVLDLRCHGLREISEEVFNLTWLEKLHLPFLEKIPKSIKQLKKLKVLDLGCGFIEIPEEVFKMTWLEGLHLPIMEEIPESIRHLKKLKVLSFRGNDIDHMGQGISDISPLSGLKNLSKLDLSENPVTDLSPLSNLVNLSELDLSWNSRLDDISPLFYLVNLSKLDLSGTRLTDISPLSNLKNLSKLDLSDSPYIDISPLCALVNLSELDLSYNELTDISPLKSLIQRIGVSLQQKPNVNTVIVGYNPLQIPPPEIIRRGKAAVLRYFADIEKQKT